MSNVGDRVYLVWASRGQFSDREEWVVSVHETETGAREALDKADAEYRDKWAEELWEYDRYEHSSMCVYLSISPMRLEW
jgi:hypothetical protein